MLTGDLGFMDVSPLPICPSLSMDPLKDFFQPLGVLDKVTPSRLSSNLSC